MSSEKNMQRLIKEFLSKVKEKLPEWMKEKKEHKEVIRELEEHIWDKAEDLAPNGEPTEQTVRQAIWALGTPKEIAKEYKRRGTPKVYITEELWPYYTKSLIVVFGIIIIAHIVGFVFSVLFAGIFDFNIFNIFTNILAAFAIITIIFVALSMEGYLPEDFKSKVKIEKERKAIEKAKAEGKPLDPKTGKPIKPIVKPGEKIAGAIFGFIFAGVLILMPIPFIRDNVHPQFLMLLQLAGYFIIGDAVITLMRGMFGNENITGQQVTLIMVAGLKFASIWLFFLFWNQPEIVRIFYVNQPGDAIIWIPLGTEFYGPYQSLWLLIMIIQIISACYDIYKSGNLSKYKQFTK